MLHETCQQCGTAVKNDAFFCTNCGCKLQESVKSTIGEKKEQQAALAAACIEGIRKAIQFFNIDTDYDDELSDTNCPLIQVVHDNDEEMLTALLAERADVNQTDDNNNTALMIAAETGNSKIVAILLAHNADITMENDYDETALDIARNSVKQYIVGLLNKAR
ncbi:MAG: ankyrin repeat domain-containing protein [Treponema sp.]